MELTQQAVLDHYMARFDETTRRAHTVVLSAAIATRKDRWPTLELVRRVSNIYGVAVEELRRILRAYPAARGAGGLGGCVPLARQPASRPRNDERGPAPGLRDDAGDARGRVTYGLAELPPVPQSPQGRTR